LLLLELPAARLRLLKLATDLFDQVHRATDRDERIVRSPQSGVAARLELVELDQVADSTSTLGLGKRLLELGQRRGEAAAGERHLAARGEGVQVYLPAPDETGILAAPLGGGYGGALLAGRQLGFGQQRQSLGCL